MRDNLLEAILAGTEWTERFHRREYEKAFQEYTERFGVSYISAVREAGEQVEKLAEEILDELEARVRQQRFWNRTVYRVNAKLTIVEFLSPMLLAQEEPGCVRLAEVLRDMWNTRYPKENYKIASYEKIRKGFKNVILGIELPDRRRDDEEE